MLVAKIYRPCKSHMQSGKARSEKWLLEFLQKAPYFIDPIIGWSGASDMFGTELKLYFSTKEQAINYVKKNNISYFLHTPEQEKICIKHYVNNFK